jgi:acyl-CoA synthetase (AMP-forming)/AMP-acid ligase II
MADHSPRLDDNGLVEDPSRPLISGDNPQSVADVLEHMCRIDPGAEALVASGRRYSYRELDRTANRAANALLAAGVMPGDRVAACLPNGDAIVIAFLGACRVGAIWVGVGKVLAPREKLMLIKDSGASLMLTESVTIAELEAELEPGGRLPPYLLVDASAAASWDTAIGAAADDRPDIAVDPFAPAAISYTSGTTGLPKGAVHTQHNIVLVCVGQREIGRYRVNTRQGVVLPLTLLNNMICGPVAAFVTASCCVVMPSTRPREVARVVREERLVTFAAVPAMIYDLLTDPDVTDADLVTLTDPWVGGSEPPESFRELYAKRFSHAPANAYGLTESPNGVATEVNGMRHVKGSSGTAYPTLRISVHDPASGELGVGETGEICVGPRPDGPWKGVYTPMLGYWRRPEETKQALRDGLLWTGDLGYLDAAGHVFITGRKKEVIMRGGSNVYPAEVERVLIEYPGVADCAVFGIPDDRLGQRVVAVVQPDVTAELDPAALQEFARARCARYKVPEQIRFVPAFPRTAMGKIRKIDLVGLFAVQ